MSSLNAVASTVDLNPLSHLALWNRVVFFNEFGNWNDAVLVSFNFLVNMECLKLSQDLDYSSLQSSTSHESNIVWISKSLFSNLYPLDRSHSVADLIVLTAHEIASTCILLSITARSIFKDQNITLSFEINFV